MGRVGDSLDNAVAESFFATLKRELGGRWVSVEQARLAVFSWIAFYNQRRRHSAIGYHSPVDYERITAHQEPDAARNQVSIPGGNPTSGPTSGRQPASSAR